MSTPPEWWTTLTQQLAATLTGPNPRGVIAYRTGSHLVRGFFTIPSLRHKFGHDLNEEVYARNNQWGARLVSGDDALEMALGIPEILAVYMVFRGPHPKTDQAQEQTKTHAGFLVVGSEGFTYHPPLGTDGLNEARALYYQHEQRFIAAMEAELPLLKEAAAKICLYETMGPLEVLEARRIRQSLFVIDNLPQGSLDRATHISALYGQLVPLAQRAGRNFEEFLATARNIRP